MKKRLVSVVLALVMTFSLNIVAFAAPGGGVTDIPIPSPPGISSASAELFIDFAGY